MVKVIKRFVCLALAVSMIGFSLTACGDSSGANGSGQSATKATETTPKTGGQSNSSKPTLGQGNTVSNILAGGRYASDGNKLFMLDYESATKLGYINKDGMPTDFGASKEGIVGYLNIWDDYLYYMTYGNEKGVRRSVNATHNGYNIYRKEIKSGSNEELVASGVSDYSTGFYIVNGLLYYNTDKEVVTIDLNSADKQEKREKGIVLLAVNEEGFYFADRKSGEGHCRYTSSDGQQKDFFIGKIFDSNNFVLPQTGDARYAIAIEGLNYYYVDSMLQDSTISKATPNGKEKVADLRINNFDHATGIFVMNGVLYASMGHHNKNSYVNGEMELDGLYTIKNGEYSPIKGTDNNSHIIYMDSKTPNLCIYKTNGKYFGTSVADNANVNFGISQFNQLMYEPSKNTTSKAVVSLGHEENIP